MKRFRKINNQNGAAMVEFAIVLPLLLIFIFGIIEFSVMFYDKAIITNASREAARVGIVYSSSVVLPSFTKAQRDALIHSTAISYSEAHLITFGGSSTPTTTIAGDCTDNPGRTNAGTTLTTRVKYTYTYLVLPNFISSLIGPMNLSAETVMRCE